MLQVTHGSRICSFFTNMDIHIKKAGQELDKNHVSVLRKEVEDSRNCFKEIRT